LKGVHVIELNAEDRLPFCTKFDRILLDAPCSGTGTLARHPEIRWRLRPAQLRELHKLQLGLLKNALLDLGPGARLVYSTCSIEPEENEQVVAEALREDPSVQRLPAKLLVEQLRPSLLDGSRAEELFLDDGCFRTSPAVHHTDGFFAAVLERA